MPAGQGDFPEALKKDAYKWFWSEYDKLPTVYPQVFKVEKSDSAWDKATSGVGTALLEEKEEFQDLVIKTPTEGYIAYGKVRSWGKAVPISRELQDDFKKLSNFMKSMMPQWTQDCVETKETFYANVFNYGGYTAGHDIFNASIPNVLTDPSGDYIYDSSPLFAPSGTYHTSKGGGTYYNGLGASSFSLANLKTAWLRMTTYNNRREDDTIMSIMPDTILANPAMKFDIDQVLNSSDDPTTTNRAINVVKGLVKPLYWQYLTDTDQWTLAKLKFGLTALERTNPEFDMWEDKLSKTLYLSIFTRFGHMITDWRGLVSANYATA
jgi:hypothetical protein